MSIRRTFSGISETILGFEAAAANKIDDGFNLMAGGSHGQGVELMGFAVEMLLKSAYLRLDGYPDTDPITQRQLQAIVRDMVDHHGVTAPAEKLHDLQFWAEAIITKRALKGLIDTLLETEIRRRVLAVSDNWWVGMRYHDTSHISYTDVQTVFDNVMWIQSNHSRLWR
jgi:hypothetical protein